MKAYKFDLIEVLWADAATEHGWEDSESLDDAEEIAVTVGFPVKESNLHLWLASTYDSSAQHNARIKIPKGMIRKRTVLKKAKVA